MIVTSVHTNPVHPGDSLLDLIDSAVPHMQENTILVVTSKIVSLSEQRIVKNDGTVTKESLVQQEAQYYIADPAASQYHVLLTIHHDTLIANAGIDESNGNGYFILWPEEPFASAKRIWEHLRSKHTLTSVGVIITDSRLVPMRWGTLGVGIGFCGFEPLNTYIGKPDIFGTPLKMTKLSVLDSIAAASVGVMGEGNEQTPLAIVTDIPFVQFSENPPTDEEIQSLRISKEEDIYAPLTNSPRWKTGVSQKHSK